MATGQHKTELRTSGSQAGKLPEPMPSGLSALPDDEVSAFSADGDPIVGATIGGRYRVLRKLGEGGMGAVYLAEHIAIEKKVALKILLYEFARKEDLKQRFLQEAKAAARIGHENIVDITDFGETKDGRVFFVMEALEGEELSDIVKREGAMTWSRAKPIILQISRAIGAAHSKEIVHRDMKPENIFLIEREGRKDFVKILDFGIAKVSSMSEGDKKLTRTGMIFGTPEYMSPEQAQGHKADHRVDIYAVGVIMYEMVTGSVPFKADTFMGILTKHIFEQPVLPSQARPDLKIPPDVDAIIMKAMAKNRDERFQSMSELAAAITQSSGRMTRPTGDFSTKEPRFLESTTSSFRGGADLSSTLTPPKTEFVATNNKSKMIGIVSAIVLALGGAAAAVVFSGDSKKTTSTVAIRLDTATTSTKPAVSETPAKTEPAPTPATKPERVEATAEKAGSTVESVEIGVDSDPQGAVVYVDGQKQDKETPATLTYEMSDRMIVIRLEKMGYLPKEIKGVKLNANRDVFRALVRNYSQAPSGSNRRPSNETNATKPAQAASASESPSGAKPEESVKPAQPEKTEKKPSTLQELRQPDW